MPVPEGLRATMHPTNSDPGVVWPRQPATKADILDAARRFSPDQLPDQPHQRRSEASTHLWVYERGQYELAILHRLVRDGFAANRFVDFAPNFGDIRASACFRRALRPEPAVVTLYSEDPIRVLVDGKHGETTTVGGTCLRVIVPAGGHHLEVAATGRDGNPPTFTVLHDEGFQPGSAWECSDGEVRWDPIQLRPGQFDLAPHHYREPTVSLPMQLVDGVFTLPAPVLGKPVIECVGTPRIRTGESLDEALNNTVEHESRHDLVQIGEHRWTSRHELGFRFLVVLDATPTSATVEASAHPVARRGAFVCSDTKLNAIWASSVYTLRMCMHGLMIDGIKRDRMPWMGDQALNTLSNAFATADADIVRDSMVALGQPRHGYINGISDYSLWWVINNALYLRYFGDVGHARREVRHIHRFLQQLERYADPDGVFRPTTEQDSFAEANHGSVFVDWGVHAPEGRTLTALQMMWYWALRSGAELCDAVAHPAAAHWGGVADRVRDTITCEAWDEDSQAWREFFGESSTLSPYPNFLAVLSGMTDLAEAGGVRNALLANREIGTPFMTTFALRALIMLGEPETVVASIRERWGLMLDAGTRTFWEEFEGSEQDRYAMYGRPYGKSLCHAWSSGPAVLLPEAVLGIRPLRAGWTCFEVQPTLGALNWASAVVPVPQGEIVVVAHSDSVTVDIPPDTTLIHAKAHVKGPQRVTWTIGPTDDAEPRTSARQVSTAG